MDNYVQKQLTRYYTAWSTWQSGETTLIARNNIRVDAVWRLMSYLNLFEAWGLPSDCTIDLSLRSAVVQHVTMKM